MLIPVATGTGWNGRACLHSKRNMKFKLHVCFCVLYILCPNFFKQHKPVLSISLALDTLYFLLYPLAPPFLSRHRRLSLSLLNLCLRGTHADANAVVAGVSPGLRACLRCARASAPCPVHVPPVPAVSGAVLAGNLPVCLRNSCHA